MTKCIKKFFSLVVIGMIYLQLFHVNAQSFTQDRVVVNHFDTFAWYESTVDQEIYPEGWEKGVDVTGGTKKCSVIDPETGSTGISVKYLGRLIFPFDEVISTGKIKVSFDMKTVKGTSSGDTNFSSHFALDSGDVNVRNYNYNGAEFWGDRRMTYFTNSCGFVEEVTDLAIKTTGDGTRLGDSVNKKNLDATAENTGTRVGTNNDWHKYEVLIDLEAETPTVYGYVDGAMVYQRYTRDNARAIKDFFFRQSGTVSNYIDNFYVNHFFEDRDDAPMITIDDETEVGTANIVFSTAINSSVSVDDFEIITSSGEAVKPLVVEVLPNSTVKLTMPELEKGVYTIKCVGTSVIKAGVAPSNTVTYTEVGNVDIEADEILVYENFDRYRSGVPTDWFGIGETITSNDVSADNGALKLNAGKTISYNFKNNIIMGDMSYIRFKVKNGTKWTMNLLDEAAVTERFNSDGTRWIYQSAYNKLYDEFVDAELGEWLLGKNLTLEQFNALTKEEQELILDDFPRESTNQAWFGYIGNLDEATLKSYNDAEIMKSVLVGSDGTHILANTSRASDLTNATVVDGELDKDGDGWTTIAIDLSFDASKFDLKVDGQTATSIAYDKDRFDRIMLVDTDSNIALREPIHGLGGIAFTADSSNAIVLDDVQVNNGDSYNLYNNFNIANGSKKISDGYRFPGMYIHSMDGCGTYGPLTANETSSRITDVQYADDGMDGSACLLLGDATNTYPLVYMLTTPVKKYAPFVIEFDVHSDNGWYVGFVNQKDSVFRGSNTKAGTVTSTGEEGKSNPTANLTRVFHLNEDNKFYAGTIHTGSYSFPFASNGVTMTNTDSEFWHIKLEVKWDETNLNYRLSTNKSGSTNAPVVSDWIQTTPSVSWMRDDIVGLVLSSQGATRFDNLKVYEANKSKVTGISAVKAISATGTETKLSDGANIENNVSAIEVEFTLPIENASGLKFKYSDGINAPINEMILSSNKKSIIANIAEPLEAGKELVLEVSHETPVSANSYTEYIRTISRIYNVVEAQASETGEVTITDFRLYQNVADTLGGKNYLIPGGLYPARITELSQKDLANYKAVIKGYNTGADAQIYTLIAGYDTTGEYMAQVVPVDAVAKSGEFIVAVDLSELTAFAVLGEGKIKGFLWDKDTYAPIMNNFEYNWSAPLAE